MVRQFSKLLSWEAKRKKRKGLGSQYPFQDHISNDLESLHLALPLKGSAPL
jgi:hypothetical protein